MKWKYLFRSWKTSLIGCLGGIAGVGAAGAMTPEGKINWPAIIAGIGLAAMGAVAKDHDVTGKDTPAPKP